jgi:hypothetical protein
MALLATSKGGGAIQSALRMEGAAMISTVTTSTVSTVTTTVGMAASLGLITILMLAVLLVAKELAGADDRPQLQRLSWMLNVAILPLSMVFAAIVAANVVEVL